MNRITEANFLPSPVEEAKEKPRILVIDDNRKIIDSGKLAPVIDRILPLSEARRAHELSQSGHTHGKIALRVSNRDGTLERKQS
jgi:NADPH:quinone reductase-like Zn-dependent oxidoreductase